MRLFKILEYDGHIFKWYSLGITDRGGETIYRHGNYVVIWEIYKSLRYGLIKEKILRKIAKQTGNTTLARYLNITDKAVIVDDYAINLMLKWLDVKKRFINEFLEKEIEMLRLKMAMFRPEINIGKLLKNKPKYDIEIINLKRFKEMNWDKYFNSKKKRLIEKGNILLIIRERVIDSSSRVIRFLEGIVIDQSSIRDDLVVKLDDVFS